MANLISSYFSIGHDLILLNEPLPYDLYVNSSALENKDKFVRIFPKNDLLDDEHLKEFIKKYFQLYIPETQRDDYIRSLVKNKKVTDEQKTEVIKDSAIKYLDKLFNSGKDFNTELLSETIKHCREAVESMVDVLHDYKIDDLRKLIGNLSFHDFYTFDHSINVAMYSITIYRGYFPLASRNELIHVGLGGLLHDLGKVKISTEILNNPGKLSAEEYAEIKKHPDFGIDLLLDGHCEVSDDLDVKLLGRMVHEHHENLDGSGYPNGLKENEISFYAKVVSTADFFDAITTKRAYNQVLSIDEALKVMSRTVGIKLDQKIFQVFTREAKKIILKDTITQELEPSFDPAISYEELPLKPVEAPEKEKEDFGKIINKQK
jgi:HD-GYP domain-containing protein (c-di-GMP phosphodiesterase class II)